MNRKRLQSRPDRVFTEGNEIEELAKAAENEEFEEKNRTILNSCKSLLKEHFFSPSVKAKAWKGVDIRLVL